MNNISLGQLPNRVIWFTDILLTFTAREMWRRDWSKRKLHRLAKMTPRLPQSPAGSCGYQCKGKTVLCYPSPSCCQDSNRFKPLAPTSAVFLDKLRVKTQHCPFLCPSKAPRRIVDGLQLQIPLYEGSHQNNSKWNVQTSANIRRDNSVSNYLVVLRLKKLPLIPTITFMFHV